jgi:CheY-like chemotaxis protein/DNA-directed RNA polymerase specialized sigma24 family protein
MTTSHVLAPHLPYLRRYARALTGAQEHGDALVRAVLTALASKEQMMDPGLSPRLGLYKLFHRVWAHSARPAARPGGSPEPVTGTTGPDRRLGALGGTARAALLLTAVEGFNSEDAGTILDMSPEQVELAVLEAQKAIESALVSRVLIIEDEPIIALDLETLVEELGHKVVATAANRGQAVQQALAQKPGLILADINLGEGGSGIDAVNDILTSFEVPVIFITAYPERLLTGARPEPTYLIAKPFLPETVQATVGQALFFHPLTRHAA